MNNRIIKGFLSSTCLTAAIAGACVTLSADQAHAGAYQLFLPGTYINPAMNDLTTQTFTLEVGATSLFPQLKYKGSVGGGPNGTSKSRTSAFLPHGQIAYRVHPKWVIAFDVSDPLYAMLNYKHKGPASNTKATIIAQDYSPKVSYQLLDNFTIGLGLDIYNASDFTVKFNVAPNTPMTTRGKAGRLGWDAGFLWKISQASYFSGDYHSGVFGKARGNSQVLNIKTQSYMSATIPATFSLNFLQFFSKEFLVSVTGRYVQWKRAVPTFVIGGPAVNPTGKLVFIQRYKNSFVGSVYSRYQFDPQWAVFGAVEYDSNMQPTKFRPVIFPAASVLFLAAGVTYMPHETLDLTTFVGYAISNAKINHAPELAKGKTKIRVPLVEVSAKYHF
jgi:long-subunit fatty acid transport protein